jgi:hypothetical protein
MATRQKPRNIHCLRQSDNHLNQVQADNENHVDGPRDSSHGKLTENMHKISFSSLYLKGIPASVITVDMKSCC